MKDVLFFYSHTKGDYKCFSQWYPCSFSDIAGTYSSAEQYMMYNKALLFKDFETAEIILSEKDPDRVKKLGRIVKNFDQSIWFNNCQSIVFVGNLKKFKQNEDLKKILLSTSDLQLVEASRNDRIWGIGFSENEAEVNRQKWGTNYLGVALMKVRKELRK